MVCGGNFQIYILSTYLRLLVPAYYFVVLHEEFAAWGIYIKTIQTYYGLLGTYCG